MISKRTRFLNFIIDLIIFSILGTIILVVLKTTTDLLNDEYNLNSRILSLVLYLLYYLVFELTLYTTPGKLLTKTKIVSNDNETPAFDSIVIRTLLRIVPFEPISIFFNDQKLCWHDQFSKTKIIHINH